MHLRLMAELLVVACILLLWIRQRRKAKQHITDVNNRLTHLESVLGSFINECEKTFSEFSLRVTEIDKTRSPSTANTPLLGDSFDGIHPVLQEETIAGRSQLESIPKGKPISVRTASKNTRESVLRLAREGATSREIVAKLGIPQGEVELVFNLRSAATHAKKAQA